MPNLRSPNLLLGVALLLGVCADILFYSHGLDGIALPIFTALGLLTLLLFSRTEERPGGANSWLGPLALSFAVWLAVRAEPTLVALNWLALVGLLLLLAIGFRSDAILRLTLVQLIGRSFLALVEVCIFPFILAARQLSRLPAHSGRLRNIAPVLRGALIAAPLLLIFGVLFAAADSIFASYVDQLLSLQLPFDVATAVAHSLFVGCFTLLVAGGVLVALSDGLRAPATLPAEGDTERLDRNALAWRFLGSTEALTVLTLLDLLFGGFMLIQGAYLFGGHDSLARTGMTYADYARRGFFELLSVAFLALGLLCVLALITRRESARRRRLFNVANGVLVLLVLGVLASAFQRMWLYELAYGFTRLRIYTHSFMIWLALVLLLFMLALVRSYPRIFTSGVFASALVYLTILNIISPDALIVRVNMARYQANPTALDTEPNDTLFRSYSQEVDLYYLLTLSSDATPDLVAALPQLNPTQQAFALTQLQNTRSWLEDHAASVGWPGWHYSQSRAIAELRTVLP